MPSRRRALLTAGLVCLSPGCIEAEADTLAAPTPVRAPAPEQPPSAEAPSPPPAAEQPPSPAPAPPSCPVGMALLGRFCVDRYEAYLVHHDAAGKAWRHPHYERPDDGVRYEARSDPGVFPQAYVSRVEAQAACENAGKRLCSRKEWQRACKGSRDTTYPYGQRAQRGRCNTEKQHLLTLFFGADSRRWTYADFNDPSLSKQPGFLARAGEYNECVSDEDIHDMVGNLHEWVSDTADGVFKARIESEGIPRAFQYWNPRNGVFMGGFYSTQGELGPGCTFTTLAHEPTYHDYSTGFRCCADAP